MSLITPICSCLEAWKEYRFDRYKQRTHDAIGMLYRPVFTARGHTALKSTPRREQRKLLLLDHLKPLYISVVCTSSVNTSMFSNENPIGASIAKDGLSL